jgi:hypothetical protein
MSYEAKLWLQTAHLYAEGRAIFSDAHLIHTAIGPPVRYGHRPQLGNPAYAPNGRERSPTGLQDIESELVTLLPCHSDPLR